MNPANEDKIEELKKILLSNQFNNENNLSLNNSLKLLKTKSVDSIYKNDSFILNYNQKNYLIIIMKIWEIKIQKK